MPIVVYLHAVIDPNMHLDVSMSGRERIGYGKCMNFPFLFDVGDHELSAFFSVVQFFMSPYGTLKGCHHGLLFGEAFIKHGQHK